MFQNISVSDFFKTLDESAATLRHGLYFDISAPDYLQKNSVDYDPLINMEISEYTIINSWLNEINEKTWSTCSCLFSDGLQGFFGYTNTHPQNMAKFDQFHTSQPFWKDIFFQHAVFSSYKKLRTLLSNSKPLSSYSAYRYSRTKEAQFIGLDYLLRHSLLKVENSNSDDFTIIFKKNDTPVIDATQAQCVCSQYAQDLEKINKSLKNIHYQIPYKDKTVPANVFELTALLQKNYMSLKKYLSRYSDSGATNRKAYMSYQHYREAFSALHSIFGEDHLLTNADRLYLSDLIDNLFVFKLFNCLFQNLLVYNDALPQSEINILASCIYLPNTFSRSYLLQMSFDCLFSGINEKENFYRNSIEKVRSVATKISSGNSFKDRASEFANWLLLHHYTMNYLSFFLFPVYESLFFWFLYCDYKAIRKNSVNTSLAIELMKILSNYLNQENIFSSYIRMDSKFFQDITNTDKSSATPSSSNLPEQIPFDQSMLFKRGLLAFNDLRIDNQSNETKTATNNRIPYPWFITSDYIKNFSPQIKEWTTAFLILNFSGYEF